MPPLTGVKPASLCDRQDGPVGFCDRLLAYSNPVMSPNDRADTTDFSLVEFQVQPREQSVGRGVLRSLQCRPIRSASLATTAANSSWSTGFDRCI